MDQPVSLRQGGPGQRIAFAMFGLISLGLLGGCVETAALSGAEIPEAHASSAANAPAGNAHGVRVALASLSGAPQPLEDRLKDAFAAQASERNIALADPAKAAYLIRGYVTAYPAADGTTIAAVYDVFDARKKRAQRLEDDVVVKSGGADSWSGFNAAAIEDLAAKSADDLAAFLVATPEALADAAPASGLDPGASRISGRRIAARASAAASGPSDGARGAQSAPAQGSQGAAAASGLSLAALR